MRTSIYEDRLIDVNINIAYHCIIDGVSSSTEISPINLDNETFVPLHTSI